MKKVTTEEIVREGWALYYDVAKTHNHSPTWHAMMDRFGVLLGRIEDLKPEEATVKLYNLYKTIPVFEPLHRALGKELCNLLEIPVTYKDEPQGSCWAWLFSRSFSKKWDAVDNQNTITEQNSSNEIDKRIDELKQHFAMDAPRPG